MSNLGYTKLNLCRTEVAMNQKWITVKKYFDINCILCQLKNEQRGQNVVGFHPVKKPRISCAKMS